MVVDQVFKIPEANFKKKEVEKYSLQNAEMEQHQNISNKALINHNAMIENEFPPPGMDSVRP